MKLIVSRKRYNALVCERDFGVAYTKHIHDNEASPLRHSSTIIYTVVIMFFLHLPFSHQDAETLLPVTEPSQPAPRRTIYSIIIPGVLFTPLYVRLGYAHLLRSIRLPVQKEERYLQDTPRLVYGVVDVD